MRQLNINHSVMNQQRNWESGQNCQGCGRHNWLVGRKTVECAFCGNIAQKKDERKC